MIAKTTEKLRDLIVEKAKNILEKKQIVLKSPVQLPGDAKLSLFVYHIEENAEMRNQLPDRTPEEGYLDGTVKEKKPPLFFDLYFMITTAAKEEQDKELRLLENIARIFYENPILDVEGESIKIIPNPMAMGKWHEVWQLFQQPYRTSLGYLLSPVPVKSEEQEIYPQVLSKELLLGRLFTIPKKYQAELEKGQISEGLRSLFQEYGYSLSSDVTNNLFNIEDYDTIQILLKQLYETFPKGNKTRKKLDTSTYTTIEPCFKNAGCPLQGEIWVSPDPSNNKAWIFSIEIPIEAIEKKPWKKNTSISSKKNPQENIKIIHYSLLHEEKNGEAFLKVSLFGQWLIHDRKKQILYKIIQEKEKQYLSVYRVEF